MKRTPLRNASLFLGCLSLLMGGLAHAEEGNQKPAMSEMIVRTIPAKQFLYGAIETDFKSMGEPVVKTLTDMMEAAKEGKAGLYGPVVHYYYAAPHRKPEKRFKMETGFYVPEDFPVVAGFKSRKLPEFKCATILFMAPVLESETPGKSSIERCERRVCSRPMKNASSPSTGKVSTRQTTSCKFSWA